MQNEEQHIISQGSNFQVSHRIGLCLHLQAVLQFIPIVKYIALETSIGIGIGLVEELFD